MITVSGYETYSHMKGGIDMGIDYSGIRRQIEKYDNVESLMRYVNVESLKVQHDKQKWNKATGIDNVTKRDYGKNLEENLTNLIERMKNYKYKPKPVKRVEIPKSNGKTRPLGIPCYEDKIVQGVMAEILNTIYEPIFLDCSFGFRAYRDCHQAIKELDKCIMREETNYIVEADIKGFFDNIDHNILTGFIKETIHDKNFIRYIGRFLKSGIMKDMKYYESEKGTPQGGLISPVLANVYLHYVLDKWFEDIVKKYSKGKCNLIRYADDFVACFEIKEDAERFYRTLKKRLAKYKLEVEESKTRIISFGRISKSNDSFDFLGFTIYNSKTRNGKYRVGYKTSKKKAKQKKANIKEHIKSNRDVKPKDLIKSINRILTGYYNYYGISFNMRWLKEIYDYTVEQLQKWLSRRSQKGYVTWEKMHKIIEYNPIKQPRITYQLW